MTAVDTERRRILDTLERCRREVRPTLQDAVSQLHPGIRQVAEYCFGWRDADGTVRGDGSGGKGVRPAVTLLAAEVVGAPATAALPGAAAVELVHVFSLVHDDIMDRDELRRHRPTAWKACGTERALLTGDALLALAVATLARGSSPADAEAVRLLAECLVELVNGQEADMAFEERPWTGPEAVTVEEHNAMAAGKTGALLGCAAGLGALLGGAPANVVSAMHGMGLHLGMALQAVDDLLGIWGDPAVTGKPVLSDLRRRKKTLPVVAALTGQAAARHALAELLGTRPDTAGLRRTAALISEAQGRTAAVRQADGHLGRALEVIDRVAVNRDAAAELADLSRFIVYRSS